MYTGDLAGPAIVDEILKYPRVFLERFSGLCEPPLSFHFEIANTDDRRSGDRGSGMRRSMSGSGRHREQAPAVSSSSFGGMGNFRHNNTAPTPRTHLWERFRQSTNEMKNRMDIAPRGGSSMGGRPPSGHNRESRGGRTGTRGRGRGRGRGGSQQGGDRSSTGMSDGPPLDLKPLAKAENRYIAKVLVVGKNAVEDEMDEEVYNRRIYALLNKMTPDNFDSVSDELLVWGNKSLLETNGRILRHLIDTVFFKATDEKTWVTTYARLCLKLICNIDPNIADENVKNKEGNPIMGGLLVRKYLLTKCQEDFERGWKIEMPDDMESDEYYEAAKIKRRGLGLVQFIGELFLRDILTERIMHQCFKRLLTNYETPEEEETESLCKLMTTVGKKLDHEKAKSHVDAYFRRIQAMSGNKKLASRYRFMLKDIIELRMGNWASISMHGDSGPMTIAEIHEEVERKKAAEEKLRHSQSNSGRPQSRSLGPGGRRPGWNTVGGPSGSGRAEQNQRTGDLTGFGNISRLKQQAPAGGSGSNPFSNLSGGSRGWRNNSSDGRKSNERPRSLLLGPGGRTPSHSSRGGPGAADAAPSTPDPVGTHNMFDALMNADDDHHHHHASPRAEAMRSGSNVPALAASSMSSAGASASSKPKVDTMDSATMQRKIKGMFDEYLQLKSDSEFVECFKELGEVNYLAAISEIANNLMDRRPDQAEQIVKGVAALRTNSILPEDVAVAGLADFAEMLEDIALDAPNAERFFGMLMAAIKVPLSRAAETLGAMMNDPSPSAGPIIFVYLKELVAADGEDKTREAIEKAKFDVAQFFDKSKQSDDDVKGVLAKNGLLPLFSKFA
ncbi:hypothetical protein BX661DRAFT_181367 [Kickxella alabastrina]|uniref:uncharacterized protein n=1 Tax=Kickxella alabastrina TaxID=61397 RepID=UPI0022211E90|nr:uncharacterized protein BX661DRAFT_181367 [Kickxella alabastrina]KAI7829093.1 hypothetical protein BX661DRAFT_181367 [Kickxella alabastrina]